MIDLPSSFTFTPSVDDSGTAAYINSSTNQFGDNPNYSWQIFRFDPVTGSGQKVSSFVKGVEPSSYDAIPLSASVSDDGQWLAFLSRGNLVGNNHDESIELFVMKSDGSNLTQLTNDPAPNAGSVIAAVLSGSANRVVFVSNSDYDGGNPTHYYQVFVVNRDGTGLRQLTHFDDAYVNWVSISDDGQRIVFPSNANPTGENADLSTEIFAVNADGTNLRQLTPPSVAECRASQISGNGAKVVFISNGDYKGTNGGRGYVLWVMDYDDTSPTRTSLRQLTGLGASSLMTTSEWPTITDDGVTVVFTADIRKLTPPQINTDGNYEVWKIRTDGTGLTVLTNTTFFPGTYFPAVVSGSGNRIAFWVIGGALPGTSNPDGGGEIYSMDIQGGNVHQLTTTVQRSLGQADITPDGSRIVFDSSADLVGQNPEGNSEIYRMQADGTDPAQVTSFGGGILAQEASIAGDNTTIVFTSNANPTGGNADGSREIFRINADGSGLIQLTGGAYNSAKPEISRNGSVVAFVSKSDFTGGNADHNQEVYRVFPDGTGLLQLTSTTGGDNDDPHVDSTGTWIVFSSRGNPDGSNPDGSSEIFRVRTDGTGLQHVTSDPLKDSTQPDISGSGGRIVLASTANLVPGMNADGNAEIFLYEPAAGAFTQLTDTLEGSSSLPRITEDGGTVYFVSTAEFTEEDPDYRFALFRLTVATRGIERADGTMVGSHFASARPNEDGTRAVFVGIGIFTDTNPDGGLGVFLDDRTIAPMIRVSAASPTVVSWDLEPAPIRYDILRGHVASLAAGAGGTVDLDTVVCIEDDSPDSATIGSEDAAVPTPGQAFFYLYRGSQGNLRGPGSYGQGTGGGERIPSGGGCTP